LSARKQSAVKDFKNKTEREFFNASNLRMKTIETKRNETIERADSQV